jgi:basic membrane protein A and related proteins
VPADLAAKVKAREAAIREGKFAVKVDDNQPKPTAK